MSEQHWIVGDGESVPASPDPSTLTSLDGDLRSDDDSFDDDPIDDLSLVVEEPATEIEILAAERDEYLVHLQRLQADFDNFRKRAARDQVALSERASERLVEELLPVLSPSTWR